MHKTLRNVTVKGCTGCGESKPMSEFYESGGKVQAQCKSCTLERQRQRRRDNPTEANAASRAWQQRNQDRVKERRRKYYEADKAAQRERTRRATYKRKYGITVEQYDEMLSAQEGCCAICRVSNAEHVETRRQILAVDHDHATGRVRGLLCTQCNTALGLLRESAVIIERASDYLRNNGPVQESKGRAA